MVGELKEIVNSDKFKILLSNLVLLELLAIENIMKSKNTIFANIHNDEWYNNYING